MVQYIINPWRSHGELLRVRQQLYPGKNDEERREAVALVSVWMQRGNCPHLVESSAILTSAILNDVPGNSTYCVRAAYAAAFCRFVTGLLDSHQDGRKKLSMYSIAKNIGLPATYVELRHQATHEELPSLSKLRTATQKALRWIWDCYWVKLPISSKLKENCEDCVMATCNLHNRFIQNHPQRLVDFHSVRRYVEEPDDNKQSPLGGPESAAKILEDLRKEMAHMESDLKSEGTDDESREESKGTSSGDNGKGWSLWEGPWVPKPIGVV